ncbi:MAG: class I SAM-dependent methyltransferase [Blastopirellula sp.]|nr:class I SAM-dependent methyltransferase [Blastopirellula sp.]
MSEPKTEPLESQPNRSQVQLAGATPATTPASRETASVPASPTASAAAQASEPDRLLLEEIRQLGPWHMNIQLTESVFTGEAFASGGAIRDRERNKGVSLLNLRGYFLGKLRQLYPAGVASKTLLDCACNAGGYCFWAREAGMESAFGFDVRDHWIKQAKFVQGHRTVASTDRIEFQVCDLYRLPERGCSPADITMFKGIFYHLPDPVTGLKIAADLTREVMFFNTSTVWGEPDGYLKCGRESRENLMSGVHGLKWYATGPKVLSDILKWCGFVDRRLMFSVQQHDQPQLGRVEIIASKVPGLLDSIGGEILV